MTTPSLSLLTLDDLEDLPDPPSPPPSSADITPAPFRFAEALCGALQQGYRVRSFVTLLDGLTRINVMVFWDGHNKESGLVLPVKRSVSAYGIGGVAGAEVEAGLIDTLTRALQYAAEERQKEPRKEDSKP